MKIHKHRKDPSITTERVRKIHISEKLQQIPDLLFENPLFLARTCLRNSRVKTGRKEEHTTLLHYPNPRLPTVPQRADLRGIARPNVDSVRKRKDAECQVDAWVESTCNGHVQSSR